MVIASKVPTVTNEYIIHHLFKDDVKGVSGLFLIDIPEFADVTFDFSDLYFSDTEITNYGSFFLCTFNEDTFFDETCSISNVFLAKLNLKSVTAGEQHFHSHIKGDNSIHRLMAIQKTGDTEVARYLRNYLSAFFRSGTLEFELPERDLTYTSDSFVTNELLTAVFRAVDIVVDRRDSVIYLDFRLKFKLMRYLTQGIPFPQFNKAVSILKKSILGGDTNII
jgi:hypothetical protein